jgi:hypothetical protein
VKEKREAWPDTITHACGGDYAKVLFLDESGAMTNLVRSHGRSHGRSPEGERCVGFAPNGHWKMMTAVAAVQLGGGVTAAATMACPMDAQLFQRYVEEVLAPVLKPGDVVVMDNLACHKHPRVAALIASAGATLLHLPPYSPDFNPIENAFSKLKAILRSRHPCSN